MVSMRKSTIEKKSEVLSFLLVDRLLFLSKYTQAIDFMYSIAEETTACFEQSQSQYNEK